MKNENEVKMTKEMMVILGDLLERHTPEYLFEKVVDRTTGQIVPRWMILKERES